MANDTGCFGAALTAIKGVGFAAIDDGPLGSFTATLGGASVVVHPWIFFQFKTARQFVAWLSEQLPVIAVIEKGLVE